MSSKLPFLCTAIIRPATRDTSGFVHTQAKLARRLPFWVTVVCHIFGQKCLLHQLRVAFYGGDPCEYCENAPSCSSTATLPEACRDQPMRGRWYRKIRSCLSFAIVQPFRSGAAKQVCWGEICFHIALGVSER